MAKGDQYSDVDDRFKKQGYSKGLSSFLPGILDERVLSWQGKQNLSYENMTKQTFSAIKKEDLGVEGYPYDSWSSFCFKIMVARVVYKLSFC